MEIGFRWVHRWAVGDGDCWTSGCLRREKAVRLSCQGGVVVEKACCGIVVWDAGLQWLWRGSLCVAHNASWHCISQHAYIKSFGLSCLQLERMRPRVHFIATICVYMSYRA